MKRASKHGPVRTTYDSPEMSEAIDWFIRHGYRPYRVSAHQLKWRSLSYYPSTGTVRPDDAPSVKVKGLAALEQAMCDILGEQTLPLGMESMPQDAIRSTTGRTLEL
ncbi:hypothetical protein [Brevundimonas sp.]|uniref:hypothetical protein n=1 Tax=Brevundimonas sp. TaxID=1871086 RepID=UPI0028AA58EE|nr:hypothetical protein [Brevundimonas sp.]